MQWRIFIFLVAGAKRFLDYCDIVGSPTMGPKLWVGKRILYNLDIKKGGVELTILDETDQEKWLKWGCLLRDTLAKISLAQ